MKSTPGIGGQAPLSNPRDDVLQAVRLLEDDGIVAVPTETVYGLAANALRSAAVKRIFACKGRPAHNPLIVHIAAPSTSQWPRSRPSDGRVSAAEVGAFLALQVDRGLIDATLLEPSARRRATMILARHFWPGPLTLVVPKGPALAAEVTAGGSTVALRVPAHPVVQQLLTMLPFPLAAPSANPSGRISPTSAGHVVADYAGAATAPRLVLDGGSCRHGLESTVVRIEESGGATVLRPGAITRQALVEVLGDAHRVQDPTGRPMGSPGLLADHYAPTTPSVLASSTVLGHARRLAQAVSALLGAAQESQGWQGIQGSQGIETARTTQRPVSVTALLFRIPLEAVEQSCRGADLELVAHEALGDSIIPAAHALYAAMRRLDAVRADAMLIEHPPSQLRLEEALWDRLHRASRLAQF